MVNFQDWFEYRDGKLYWKQIAVRSTATIGSEAGSFNKSNGRFVVSLYKKRTLRARVIWEMHNGPIPPDKIIDHADRDRTNDRIENLRLASPSQNLANRQVSNRTGYKGLKVRNGIWKAYIDNTYLGSFDSPELAALVYNAAAYDRYGAFANLNIVVL